MQTKTIVLLKEAAEALKDNCYTMFEYYTRESCISRSDWTYEQKCRYGAESNYELADKLVALANELEGTS